MAFLMAGWSVIAASKPGAAPSMFSYKTEDPAATVDTVGYFAQVADQLRVGDLIWRATVNSSGVLQASGWHVVKDKTTVASAIDVTDATVSTATDTD